MPERASLAGGSTHICQLWADVGHRPFERRCGPAAEEGDRRNDPQETNWKVLRLPFAAFAELPGAPGEHPLAHRV